MTQVVALIALVIFAVVMVIIGVRSTKRTTTIDGFLLGGRKMGAWMSAFAYGTTYFSAVIFIGYAGKIGWDIGFAGMWIGVGNAAIGCLLAWYILAKRTRNMTHNLSARTMPEFFAARYLSRGMKIYGAAIIFIFLMPYAASVYKGLGSFFGVIFPDISSVLFGLSSDHACMIIVAILTATYLILGGYVATARTDFVQGIIMIAGIIAMALAIVLHPTVGGLPAAVEKLNEVGPQFTSIFGGSGWNFLLINILLTSLGTWGLPQMVSKFYAIKDEAAIKRATIVSTGFALIIGAGAYFVGTFGRFFVEADANGLPVEGYDKIIPNMLTTALGGNLLGAILLSIILLLLLSASMSTLASIVLTSASAITVDLFGIFKPDMDKKRQMVYTRLLCMVFVLCSLIFAMADFAIIVSIMAYSWGIVSGCFVGPYIWGLYSRKVTKAGAWSGMIGGVLTVAIMAVHGMLTSPALTDGLYAAFKAASGNSPLYGVCALGVSILIVPIVSSFTRKYSDEHVSKVFSDVKV